MGVQDQRNGYEDEVMVNASSFDSRRVIVTGASSGIGEATARMLAAEGAKVAVIGRRAERLDKIVLDLRSAGGQAYAQVGDISGADSAQSAVASAMNELGGCDALINCAGIMPMGSATTMPVATIAETFATNVVGLAAATQVVLPEMIKRARGDIVNIASVVGRVARPGGAAYSASKYAVIGWSESLRQEIASSGVRVLVIEPGIVATELADKVGDETARVGIRSRIEQMRPLQAKDVARVIVFALAQPPHVTLGEILIRPTDQVFP